MKDGVKAERILTAIGPSSSSTCGEVNLWIVPANSVKADEAGYYSQLMSDAESAKYTLRRVEFSGNQHIADSVLRKQLVHQEGDIFSRKLLDESLKNFSSVREIYPVTLADVVARLDREEKIIDLTIEIRERRRR
jgi:outer membrane protein assembly factor BamA